LLTPLDTHAHLADLPDVDSVIQRAKMQGLSGIVAVSATTSTCINTLRLQQNNNDFVHAALGIHPTEFFDQDIEASINLIKANSTQCVAIGEIGLDYWHKFVRNDKTQKERQNEFFVRQLKLARELDLPVSIHSRGAWDDCSKLALQHGSGKGVFHWYSGPLDVLDAIIDAGYYVSCTPAIEVSPELRQAMAKTPLDRILVETDSPVWIRSLNRPSEPVDVQLTLQHLAELKGLPLNDVEVATTRSAEILFRL
jgi:TatD DNase family protein